MSQKERDIRHREKQAERGYIRMTKYVPAIFRHQVESFIEQKSVEWEIAEGRAE